MKSRFLGLFPWKTKNPTYNDEFTDDTFFVIIVTLQRQKKKNVVCKTLSKKFS